MDLLYPIIDRYIDELGVNIEQFLKTILGKVMKE